MANRYAGMPQQSDYERLQRRRALNKALMEQSLQPYSGSQMVSGRVVDDRWGQGLSKIGTALAAKYGEYKADKEDEKLSSEYDQGRQRSIDKLTGTLLGKETPYEMSPDEQFDNEQIPGLQNAAKEPDRMGAMIHGATDPYLQTPGMQKVVNALIPDESNASGGRQYIKSTEGPQGILKHDVRAGKSWLVPWNEVESVEGQFSPYKQDISHQSRLKGSTAYSGESGKNTAALETRPPVEAAVEAAKQGRLGETPLTPEETEKQKMLKKREAEKIIEQPKTESKLFAKQTQNKMLDSAIDKAKDQANIWTTGFIGSLTDWIAGTPSHDLKNTLGTIKSNIGFDKLAEMRANSPTGGALGQVSDFENKLLQQVWSSLEQSQSEEQFKTNLELVRRQTEESWARIKNAYKKDYGKGYSESKEEPKSTADADPLGIR